MRLRMNSRTWEFRILVASDVSSPGGLGASHRPDHGPHFQTWYSLLEVSARWQDIDFEHVLWRDIDILARLGPWEIFRFGARRDDVGIYRTALRVMDGENDETVQDWSKNNAR